MELKWEHLVETMRVLRGWGQKELAAAVGMDTATISKYEQGISDPSAESRRRIEEVLGISEDVATSLAELREELSGVRRQDEGGIFERAGLESSRLTQAAIWLGLEELRDDRKGEPGLQWGVLISTVRTLRGWGQEELARRAGVNTSTVSRQERGTAQAREAVRKKILNALGLQEIEERVRFELGGIRAMMLAPSREVVRPGIEEAGAETRQFITDALERWFRDHDDGGQEDGPRVVLPEGEGQDPEQI